MPMTEPGHPDDAPASRITSMDSEELIGFFLIGVFGCLTVFIFAKFVL
jgi:hypothetical protein